MDMLLHKLGLKCPERHETAAIELHGPP